MRSRKPRQQITRVAAYGLVLQDDRILLCRLSERVPNIGGRWTLPGGGVEFGEDPALAVTREVYEETGMKVRTVSLAGVNSYASENQSRKFHSIRIIYHTELLGGSLRFESDGSTDLCGWWTYDEARELPLVNLGELGLELAFGRNPIDR
jgi:ADP-ribose pyrophosphatase YjhB (NUDIX family)